MIGWRTNAPQRAIVVPITAIPSAPRVRDYIRVEEYGAPAPKPVTVAEIQAAVSAYFDLNITDMKSQRRSAHIAKPRQLAMYIARHHTLLSLPSIGRLFGNRDHSTVIFALKQVASRLDRDPETRAAHHAILHGLGRLSR